MWQIFRLFKNFNLQSNISRTSCGIIFVLIFLIDVSFFNKHDFFHDFWLSRFSKIALSMYLIKIQRLIVPGFWCSLGILFQDHQHTVFFYSMYPSLSLRIFSGFLGNFASSKNFPFEASSKISKNFHLLVWTSKSFLRHHFFSNYYHFPRITLIKYDKFWDCKKF